jgi:predicted ATPase
LAELGQLERGVAEMETGLAGFGRVNGATALQYGISQLAKNYARMGRIEDAFALLNDALTHIERTGATLHQADMLRLKGDMLLMRDSRATDKAEACFRTALEVGRAQGARWWELRTSVTLARLLRDTNRRDEARSLLTEIYNWFTEGFDLPDLKEAKALIEELSA